MERLPAEIMLQFCKAMADETRLKLVGLLAAAEHSVQQLASMLEVKESTISHHLAVLKQLDLVRLRADGNFRWYRLDEAALEKISRAVFSRDNIARLAAPAEVRGWEHKILDTFVEQDRLREIPASRKKRLVILKWLANSFAPDISYTESEVNTILKLHHNDCATLRREMVESGILAREQGVYRRNPESQWKTAGK